MMILAAFSSCCCYEFLATAAAEAFDAAAAGPGWENTMSVKDGEAPKLHPKMPNVTSETNRK